MDIKVEKLTDETLMRRACGFTRNSDASPATATTLQQIYQNEHSPMRTQLFWIEFTDIPTYVAVHFRTHHVGIEHYVQSRRGQSADRDTPVNHAMLANAQALINLSKERLCTKADAQTRKIWMLLVSRIKDVDPDLVPYLVPKCVYRRHCPELKSCGWYVPGWSHAAD